MDDRRSHPVPAATSHPPMGADEGV